ncbi:hypothetical protein D3C76_1368490 [compost metagenome]
MHQPMNLSVDLRLSHHAVKYAWWQKIQYGNNFVGDLHNLKFRVLVIKDIFQKYHQNYFQHPTLPQLFLVARHKFEKHDLKHRDIAPTFVFQAQHVLHRLSQKDNPK